MSHITALDNIIRLARPDEIAVRRPGATLVWYDPADGAVLDKRPPFFLSLRGGSAQAYLIFTGQLVEHPARPLPRAAGADNQHGPEISIHCWLRCPVDNIQAALKLLAGMPNPSAVVDHLIDEAAMQYQQRHLKDGIDPVAKYFRDWTDGKQSHWESEIERHVSAGTGLETSIRFKHDTAALNLIRVEQDYAEVWVDDSNEQLFLAYKAYLEVRTGEESKALETARRRAELEANLLGRIRRAIREKYQLQHLCLEQERVNEFLRETINDEARKLGRQVSFFTAEWRVPSIPPLKRIEHPHKCRVKDWAQEFDVEHIVLLQIQDFARFRRSGIKDVDKWIRETLEEITQETLFECGYVQVVSTFAEELQGQIRNRMKQRAAEKGLHVAQYSSVPKIDVLDPNGFRFAIEEASFSTKNPRLPARLSVFCHGKVEELHKIKDHLAPGVDVVRTKLTPAVHELVAEILHETSPERFYLQFETMVPISGAADTPQKKIPVAREIREAIVKEIRAKYGVECKVTVKLANTDVTKRYDRLLSARGEFLVTILPKDGTAIDFVVSYRVVAVGDWEVFQNGEYTDVAAEVGDITNLMKNVMAEKLNNVVSAAALQYDEGGQHERLKQALFYGVKEPPGEGVDKQPSQGPKKWPGIRAIVNQFQGVLIEATSFVRRPTLAETIKREISEEILREKALERKAKHDHHVNVQDLLRAGELRERERGYFSNDNELKRIQHDMDLPDKSAHEADGSDAVLLPHPLPPPQTPATKVEADSIEAFVLGPDKTLKIPGTPSPGTGDDASKDKQP